MNGNYRNHTISSRLLWLPYCLLLAACSSGGGGADGAQWHQRFGNQIIPKTSPLQTRLAGLHTNAIVGGFSDEELKDGLLSDYFGAQPGIPVRHTSTDGHDNHRDRSVLGLQDAPQQIVGRLLPRNTSNAYDARAENGTIKIGHHLQALETDNTVRSISPISPANFIGSEVWDRNGRIGSQGESIRIADTQLSKALRERPNNLGGSPYTRWFGQFNKQAYTWNLPSLNGIVSLHDKNGLHNNLTGTPNWQLNLKFTDEYRQRLLTSYGKENIYLSRNGEWARKIHIDTAMPVSTDDAGSRTRVLDAQGREAPKDAQGRYLLDKGNYALIQEKDGLLRIEPWQEGRLSYFGAAADDWSSPQDPYSAHHSVLAGIEDAGAPGAFSGKRVIANLFSASGHDTPQEQRALHSYDVGLANGYNQAYLSLYTWQLKNEQGQYPGGVHNIGVFNRVDNEYFSLQNRYGVNGETLDVSYSGVAYSNKDGQQDGVLNMQAHFRNQLTPDERANAALDTGRIYGAIDPYRFSYEGKITGRHHDDGRDIYFASGNVRTDDGSMPQHQGQEISIQDSTGQGHLGSLIGTTTVWMQGQNPGEEPVIYGSGDIIFAGPHVEEVGGLLKITTSHGPHTIGFVGKRD